MQNKTKKNRKNCKDCKGIFCQHDNCGKELAKLPFSLSIAEQSMDFLETLLKENEDSPEQILKLSSQSELFQLGIDPVCVVAAMGHMEGMRRFLAAGSDINEKTSNDGNTPLMLATQNRHIEMVELLLNHSADVTAVNSDGNNSFMIAVRTGDAKLVNLIWAYRGTLNVNHRNTQGCTALHIAADKIWESCVQFLLTNGAEINKVNSSGWTPLMLASMKGDMKTTQRLVESGADILREDFMGYTATCWALDSEKVDIIGYLLGNMGDAGRNDFVKNRVERLKTPLDETDAESFYEEVLIPMFQVLSKMAAFRPILHKNRVILDLPFAIQKHLKNTTLIVGVSLTCISLLFDPKSESHIDERFVRQYTKSRLPDMCLKSMKMHLDSTKVLNDTMVTFFIPYLCMIESSEGKEWLEKNSTKIVTYTGLRERFDLYKHPDEKIKVKIIAAWKRFWEYFEQMLQRQRDQKMCELLEEEERERSRKSKKREKRKLKKQRNQQYKVAKEQNVQKETETVEDNITDKVGDVQVNMEWNEETKMASENVVTSDITKGNITPKNKNCITVTNDFDIEKQYEQLSLFDTTENAWVTVQGKKMQDRSAKMDKHSEDAWKMKSTKRKSITPQKKDDVKNWADVAKGKNFHENHTRKENKRKPTERQYDEEFPSLPNSRRSSDIGIASTSFTEEKPSPPENWDDSDGQSSSGLRECTYAELLQGQKQNIPVECENSFDGVVSLKAIADNVLFTPYEKLQPSHNSSEPTGKSDGRAAWKTTPETAPPVVEAFSSYSSDVESLENDRILDELSPRSDWSDILLEENMKMSEAMNAPKTTETSAPCITDTEHERSIKFLTEVLKAANAYGKAGEFLPIDQSNPNYENLLKAMHHLPKDGPFSTIYPVADVASDSVDNLANYLLPEFKPNNKHRGDWRNVNATNIPKHQISSEKRQFGSHQYEHTEKQEPIQTTFERSNTCAINTQHHTKDNIASCSPRKQKVMTPSHNLNAPLFEGRQYSIVLSETAKNVPIEISENVAVVKPIGYNSEIDKRNTTSDSTMFYWNDHNGFTSSSTVSDQRRENCPLGESILQNAANLDTTSDEIWSPSSLDGIPVITAEKTGTRENDQGFFFPSFHDATKPTDEEFRNACNQMELLKLLQLQKYFKTLCQGDSRMTMSEYFSDFWYYASSMGLTKEAIDLLNGKVDQHIDTVYRNLSSYNACVNPDGKYETENKTKENSLHPNENYKDASSFRMEKQPEVESVIFPRAGNGAKNIFTQEMMSRLDCNQVPHRTDQKENNTTHFMPFMCTSESIKMGMSAETNQDRYQFAKQATSNSSSLASSERTNIKWNPRSKRWRNKLADILKLPPEFRKHIGNIIIPWKCGDTFKVPYSDKNVQLGFLIDGSEVAVETIDLDSEPISVEFLHSLTSNAMSHYFLVKYKSYALDSNTCYLAMDLHEYTLDEFMHLIQLNYDADALSVNKLAWQVLKGLSSLHENCGIYHGNIMPSNIMIDLEGKIRLSEYGFTRKVMNTNQLIVSDCPLAADRRCWVPTEVMTETAPYTMKSDIQVAGMLLYYILTGGRHPFGISSSLEIQCGIHHNWPTMVYFLEEANHLISEMIKMPPEDRPTVSDLMRHPYFWADEKRLRFVLIVGSDVLRDLKLGVPTSGGTGNTMIDIMNSVGCDTTFSEWINVIDPLIMKEMRSFRQYKNTLVELVLFIYNCCLHFDKLSQMARELIDEPCRYFLTKFPTLFMCVYRAIKSSARQEKTCYKPFF